MGIEYRNLNLMSSALLRLLLPALLTTGCAVHRVTPLPNAHAHNDYLHPRPLHDALAHGFASVEADIHLVNGELYVSHDAPDTARAVLGNSSPPVTEIYAEIDQGQAAEAMLRIG